MDEIRRLLRVTAEREESVGRAVVRFRIDRDLLSQLWERLNEDDMDMTSFMEAVCRGYVRGHHAILAMLDQWRREERPGHEVRGPKLTPRDLDEIYAAVEDGGKVDGG